jgi:[ribosomal protein S5]-alanine N-acetyltransferase
MMLGSGALTLRSFRAADVEPLARIANNPNVARNLLDRFPHPYSVVDAERWIAFATSPEYIDSQLAIEMNGKIAGGIGFHRLGDPHHRCAELGYWVAESHWGLGIATAAVSLVTELAFRHHDYDRLEAGVFSWNEASKRVLEKNGYTLEGVLRGRIRKQGRAIDQHMYARLRPSG